jgi:predicted AlkP superfamily pyrophosphatase or phosphodiesterase
MKLKYPDYGNCLVNFANSLLKKYGVKQYHESLSQLDDLLKHHDKVVILLFDGMGKFLLKKHLSKGTYLRHNHFTTITSVFPSTTAAATNALLSGRFPIETGWLGWAQYFKEFNGVIEVFNGIDYYNKQPLVTSNQIKGTIGYEDIFTTIKKQNPNLNVNTIWPDIKPEGVKDLTEFFNRLEELLKNQGPKLIYGYWTNPDLLIHQCGVDHIKVKKSIIDINNEIEKIGKKHADTVFLILADHGLIDVEFITLSKKRNLNKLPSLLFSIESRATSFIVPIKKHRLFSKLFNRYHGQYFILKTKQQIIKEQWFGLGNPHKRFDDFIGDFVAIATDRYCFVPVLKNKEKHFKAHHAGLTEEEMLIDIMAINA